MSETASESELTYHLFLDAEEIPLASAALRLFISDEAREQVIRGFARDVLDALAGTPDERGKLTVELGPEQMKITHSAVRLLHDDLQRDQASERTVLRGILDKLPDEHTMRAIRLE